MKRFLLLLLIFSGFVAKSQVYNNEWIDYNKTYYKFKLGANAVYRITQPTLDANGLGSVPAENFQLWRNGQEISLYTSIASGAMSATDYIEFWGEMNDGKADKPLYVNPDYQLNDHWSLQTDTASYFLTVNPGASNKRLVSTPNNMATNTLAPEPYMMYTFGNYLKARLTTGNAAVVEASYIYSSSYDKGEGWTSADIGSNAFLNFTANNMHVYTSGPDPTISINATGNNTNTRSFRVQVNGTQVVQQEMDYYDYVKYQTSFPLSIIAASTIAVKIINDCPTAGDRMDIGQYEVNYPRLFNFDNLKSFPFQLPANINGNYLEIINFNKGTGVPVLYDLTNGKRYVADILRNGFVRVVLGPSSVDRKLVLVSEDNTNINQVTSFQTRNFINYAAPGNQGDYLIIANSVLTTSSSGNNPVEDYRVYRSSNAGGNYNAKTYDIDQLIDQFAFGIKKHPLSIRNFVQYAMNNFGTTPKLVFLMGKGINYVDYRNNENKTDPTVKAQLESLNLVPTFGFPASDNLFTCLNGDNIPVLPVGRLSTISGDEINVYLKKVKEYETNQATGSPYIADKAWMKNVIHVAGADDANLQTILDQLIGNYKTIISDTLYGANVNTFSKSSPEQVQQLANQQLKDLFEEGLSLILYFGHSSATALDFNLDDPTAYNNPGKYPIFIALGCNAGNLYNFDPTRLLNRSTISENFVLSPDKGSVAFLATTSLGVVQYLDIINSNQYKGIAYTKYGHTIGEILQNAIRGTYAVTTQSDFYARVHCEQISVNGDPALKYNEAAKPDYVIEDQLVKISPANISVSQTSFKIDVKMMNIGEAVDSNIVVEVKRTYPNNTTQVIQRDTIRGIRYIDSLTFDVPIVANRDKGLNKITITVDADNKVNELYETNNSITKEIFIYDDAADPIYPANYSIINKSSVKFIASTANPLAATASYRIEVDTTETFDSPLKIAASTTSKGGILEFNPNITFSDSTVYYWRIGLVPTSGTPTSWNNSSFIYLANSDPGYNQSHFYQHLKSTGQNVRLDSASRTWKYGTYVQDMFVRQGSWAASSGQESNFGITIPGTDANIHNTCWYQSVVFNVFDGNTFAPWINKTLDQAGAVGHGLYGSASNVCNTGRTNNFEYRWDSATSRKRAMDFIDNTVPDGAYVVVRSFLLDPVKFPQYITLLKYAADWKADENIYGPGQSLYQALKNAGFSAIDSFSRPRNFVFVYKKNDPSFTPQWIFTQGTFDNITLLVDATLPDSTGYISSPVFGPAKQWKKLNWQGKSIDASGGDNPTVDVYGIDQAGNELLIYPNIDRSTPTFDLSSIDATAYPNLRLKMRNIDSVHYTPYQINYWRVTDVPVPEGAIAPNITYQMDTLVEVGEPLNFKVAFKNISDIAFDSLRVKLAVVDKDNVTTIIPVPRQKPLASGDTLTVSTTLDTKKFPGVNSLYVDFNPDFDQPEQYLSNNFLYTGFYAKPDSLNPLLDVTFDGQHILNKDIVSSKPHILIKLKDEAKWLVLTDTSLVSVKVMYPDGSLHSFYFNNDTLQFTPAGPPPATDNTASVNFLPNFLQDGEYQLIITGKDESNNQAGNIAYKIVFEIINKPMISNMLNYPNPFTTSTAFVFTLTGSEVPQNLKIEIMTVTGKIVREITKTELGSLHIGRNITDFKWNGTDQYGDKLANGIYLYRVVTNLDGKSLDKYKAAEDNTDKYFNKGYGKMYLMR